MKLEVLLSVMNLKNEDLDKMNITSACTVINQCGKENIEKYKNFDIYSYNELGTANSRNRGLEHVKDDIVLLCDDDVVYNENYEKSVIDAFSDNPEADVIIFNLENPYRKKRTIKQNKRLHIYNSLNYASYNVAFKRNSLGSIRFNILFGPNGTYSSGGDDTIFIVDCLKNKLKMYSNTANLGKICKDESTWFKGYNEKYFFDKGALFTAINKRLRIFLLFQYLLRHKSVYKDLGFSKAFKCMLNGSKDYINNCKRK